MNEKPSYYGILPANVRYSKEISSSSKLVYTEITALTQKEGYCYASNAYFAELYDVSERTVTNWIKELDDAGFIDVKFEKDARGTYRKIFLPDGNKFPGGTKKTSTLGTKKTSTPHEENFRTKEYYNKTNTDLSIIEEEEENAEINSAATFQQNRGGFLQDGTETLSLDAHIEEKKEKSSGKKERKAAGPEIGIYPADFTPEIIRAFENYLKYRKEIKKPFKSERSLNTKISQLQQQIEAYGPAAVLESIETAIANGWAGTFIDRKYTNTSKQSNINNNGKQESATIEWMREISDFCKGID
jgi:predicted transcriptional regulator